MNDIIDRIAAAAPQPRQPLDLDRVVRRGRRLRRRRSGAIAAGALGLIAVLVVAVGQVQRPRVQLEVTQTPALSVLQREARPDDSLPDAVLEDRGGGLDSVLESEVRLAREDRRFRYYVAPTTAGGVCLIAVQKSGPALRAATCSSTADEILRTAGVIPLSFQAANQRRLVGIVPDGYDEVRAGSYRVPITGNVFAFNTTPRTASIPDPVVIRGPAGQRTIDLSGSAPASE
ncbi:MAG: hypothetical protein H0U48_08390 [Euzebyaceae bacterium]|nr:hypothetical protein [Euzebyaceae bacterium]